MSEDRNHAATRRLPRWLLPVLAGVLVVGTAVTVFVVRGDSDAGQRKELAKAFAGHLETTGLAEKDAGCVARSAVDKIGAPRLKGVDLGSGNLPDQVKTDVVAAVAAGMADCKVIAAGSLGSGASDKPTEVPVEETVNSLTAVYADQLGIDEKRAACVASTVVGWQLGPDAVPGGAKKPLTDALKACHIDPSEVKQPPAPTSTPSASPTQ